MAYPSRKTLQRRSRNAFFRALNPEKRQKYDYKYLFGRTNYTPRKKYPVIVVDFVSYEEILKLYGMQCHICNSEILDESVLAFDHVVSLIRGGNHTFDNIKPSHVSCNSWKRERDIAELENLSIPTSSDVEWRKRVREESSKRQSAATKERWTDSEYRDKILNRIHNLTEDEKKRKSTSMSRAHANKTPEEREAYREKCRQIKAGSPGNIANLQKGMTPEVRARALESARLKNLRSKHTEQHNQQISEGLKKAYRDGKRKPTEWSSEARTKMSQTKRDKFKSEFGWAKNHPHCIQCGTNEIPHRSNGRCEKCASKEYAQKRAEQRKAIRNSVVIQKIIIVTDPPPSRWSRKFNSCLGCEKTERPHKGHGYCTSCIQRNKREKQLFLTR